MSYCIKELVVGVLIATIFSACSLFESGPCSSHSECGANQYCDLAVPERATCVDTVTCGVDGDCQSRFYCASPGDGAVNICVPYCGDGVIQETQGETCDQDCVERIESCRELLEGMLGMFECESEEGPCCFIHIPETGAATTCDFRCWDKEIDCEDPHCCAMYNCPEECARFQ